MAREPANPREYAIGRRNAVEPGPGGWAEVAYLRDVGIVDDFLADPGRFQTSARNGRRLEHGDLVRVVAPSGIVRDLRIFDADTGTLRKGDRDLLEVWDANDGDTLMMQKVLPQLLRAGLGGGDFAVSPFVARSGAPADWRARRAVAAVAAVARIFAELGPDADSRSLHALDAVEAWSAGALRDGDPRLHDALAGAAAAWSDAQDEGWQRAEAMDALGDAYEETDPPRSPTGTRTMAVISYLATGQLHEALQEASSAAASMYTTQRQRDDLRRAIVHAVRTRFPLSDVLAARVGLRDPVPDRTRASVRPVESEFREDYERATLANPPRGAAVHPLARRARHR